MSGFGWRRGLQGFLTMITGACGAFLFSIMNAESSDEGNKNPYRTTVYLVGLVGLGASCGSLTSEIFSTLKFQNLMMNNPAPPALDASEPPSLVSECSWFFVIITQILTSFYTLLWLLYALTSSRIYELIGDAIAPLSVFSFILSCAMKPRRNERKYIAYMWVQFGGFAMPLP
ncbi:hypothetical protein TrVE_jg13529 [Triparma verrucosa]|uniref:Uncharacterized protein n=1 Tax=Triparma verrucosa TaxID=1606542 RepID=A0A9W7F7L4_9STRA|nr:hypothetical protein TrVE_jg13529 [Triparma verrucosa]